MLRPLARSTALVTILTLISCENPRLERMETAQPPRLWHEEKFSEMDAAINQAIADKKLPGAILWIERNRESYHRAYGKRSLVPHEEAMTEDTIFDAASLTKVVACTPAVMLLLQREAIGLDDPVHHYIADFKGGGKETVTIRQLLTHTSGLRPDVSLTNKWSGYEAAIDLACQEKLRNPPGSVFTYSDINFFLLGHIVQVITGKPLNEFVEAEVYRPLGMLDTRFRPIPLSNSNDVGRIAPTQESEMGMLRGVVHDPTARRMGGVAGHAGLFTTAADLAKYARMLLNEGSLEGAKVFEPEIVRLMTSVQTPKDFPARRGFGWDIDSGYSRPRGQLFPLGSYGHTGFTGTALWIDPFSKTFWIFLSNRVHPDGKGNILPLQAALGTLAAQAVDGFDFANVPGALEPLRVAVLNGIDVLKRGKFAPLRGLRVGLITNHTGRDRDGNTTIDLLHKAAGVELKALFSPEHGIRGEADEKIGDSIDEKTGLPVYSLYGERRSPAPAQLEGLDALVFDIQDIGCRFYTYLATLGNCMEAAANANLKFFVLDRANPINGIAVEGPVYSGKPIFTAYHSISLRHGMTLGELAKMINDERGFKAQVTVVKLEGWKRSLWFDQTTLSWINPSPNMRSLTAATFYPGLGLHETALSVGRGTETPFEWVGAPYIVESELVRALEEMKLPGVRFEPVQFEPTTSVFKGKVCRGVRFVLDNRAQVNSVELGLALAIALHRLYPKDFALDKIQTLLQDRRTLDSITDGKPLSEIESQWKPDLANFVERRRKFLLYP